MNELDSKISLSINDNQEMTEEETIELLKFLSTDYGRVGLFLFPVQYVQQYCQRFQGTCLVLPSLLLSNQSPKLEI